jgi:hypothetical protein
MASENIPQTPGYLFSPFSLRNSDVDKVSVPGHAVQDYMDLVQDVAMGASSMVQLIAWSRERAEFDEPELMNRYHEECVSRLLARSLTMLVEETERKRQWAYSYHTPKGIAERESQQSNIST